MPSARASAERLATSAAGSLWSVVAGTTTRSTATTAGGVALGTALGGLLWIGTTIAGEVAVAQWPAGACARALGTALGGL